jgi:hypothetical protein
MNTIPHSSHPWWLFPLAAFFFVIGSHLLIKAREIQKQVIRRMDLDPFDDYVKSPTYLLQLRIAGIVSLLFSIALSYEAYANR